MSEDLPKQELLIKLLKMTTSSNDGEAVVAVRKANSLLREAGWDWEKLIHGKIKVIADPFQNVAVPNQGNAASRPAPPTPPRQPGQPGQPTQPAAWKQPPPPQPPYTPPPPPPPPRQAPRVILSTKDNMYADWCWCCGVHVDSKAGWVFDPTKFNCYAKPRKQWQVVCHACNSKPYPNVGATAMPRRRQMVGGAAPSLGDI